MSSRNRAYGKPIERLNVLVVEHNRSMQSVIRYMISAIGIKHIRAVETAPQALAAMRLQCPDIVVADMGRYASNALFLLHTVRSKDMAPAAYVPVIAWATFSTRDIVMQLAAAGAHHILTRPTSPAVLRKTVKWIGQDGRLISLDDGAFVISDTTELSFGSGVRQSNLCGVDDEIKCLPIEEYRATRRASSSDVSSSRRTAASALNGNAPSVARVGWDHDLPTDELQNSIYNAAEERDERIIPPNNHERFGAVAPR
ncbi:MAG: response regulator [Pseudomonadota bacterium]